MNLPQAMMLAQVAHAGQRDKQGEAYVRHLFRVMEGCREHGNDAMVCGVLHDLHEDTELRVAGPTWLVLTLNLLTHDALEESYEAYVGKLCAAAGRPGALARRVKLADLADNLGRLTPELEHLRARYEAAVPRLQAAVEGEADAAPG